MATGLCINGSSNEFDQHVAGRPDGLVNGLYDFEVPCKPVSAQPLDSTSWSHQNAEDPEAAKDEIHTHKCRCNFDGTKEGCDAHRKVCDFASDRCPNGCKVYCQRYRLTIHRQTCPKEEIPCKLEGLGCKERFKREDQDSHDDSKIFHHLSLLFTKASRQHQEIQEQLHDLRLENDRNQERIQQLEEESKKEVVRIAELEQEREQYRDKRMRKGLQEKRHTLLMRDYSKKREKGILWKSSSVTSKDGLKVSIGVYANGCRETEGIAINAVLYAMRGQKDEILNWPISAAFTLKLLNFMGGDDKVVTEHVTLNKATKDYQLITPFRADPLSNFPDAFMAHSKLLSFIYEEDQLQFELKIVIVNK